MRPESHPTPRGRHDAPEERLRDRWVYISYNLLPDQNVQQVLAIMRRAKAAGYNGVVLADYKFQILDRMPPGYFRNVAAVQRSPHPPVRAFKTF